MAQVQHCTVFSHNGMHMLKKLSRFCLLDRQLCTTLRVEQELSLQNLSTVKVQHTRQIFYML